MSYETRYAAMKRQQLIDRANTPQAVRERFADLAWTQAAYADMQRAFPRITTDNAEAAIDFFEKRRRELLRAVKVWQ